MDLIARIEATLEGSRSLSDECLLAVGWEKRLHDIAEFIRPDGVIVNALAAPHVTGNLQDTLDWMGADDDWLFINKSGDTRQVHVTMHPDTGGAEGWGNTSALAFCAASLRALKEEKSDG